MGWDFAFPWAFALLLPWGVAAWRMLRRARTQGVLFAAASMHFGARRPSWRQWICRGLPFAFLIGLLALIVAAAGPRRQLSREVKAVDALAVMMAVDVSGSMQALDLSEGGREETRLDVVKRVFRDFLERRPEDLIGLVTFGGYASVRAPLTADHRALAHTLAGVEIPGMRGDVRGVSEDELMTAIGDGLSVALLRLKEAETKTKIVILLSDGESNAGAVLPMEAAEAAKKLGIRVYTIGVGSTGMAQMRVWNQWGNTDLVVTPVRLDEKTLQTIAEATGGDYANVRSQAQLEAFLRHIAELETTRLGRQVFTRYRTLARPWLMVGLGLTLLAALGMVQFIRRPL